LKRLWIVKRRNSGWMQCKMRWNLCMIITLTTWWNCLRAKGHWCVVSPQWNPLCKPNKWYQSRWLKSVQTSAVRSLYRKSSWQRVPGKRVPLRWTAVREGVLVVGNASAGGGVYQCGWRDSPLRGRMLGIQVWV